MKYAFPNSIESDYEGYKIFLDFYSQTSEISFDKIILDFGKTGWIEANLIAVLGAILNKVQSDINEVIIEKLSPKIKNILSKNHFLSHFGGYKLPDYYETTIKYRKFKTKEEKLFKEYLDRELLSKEALPGMSVLLRKKINESIFEIFSNAVIHGDCENIFTCGQSFPNKSKLDFTIVDLGATVKENVNNCFNTDFSGEDAIKWAVKEGNTTKRGMIPGGLGLSLISEFLEKNNGKIQIVSADGFLEQRGQNFEVKSFALDFPGTIVNLEFNIEDKKSYCLASEINKEDIF